MDIAVDCLIPNASFSQQLSKSLNFSSYLGYAVSIQTSCGTILGCGWFERHFPVYASYQKKILFRHYSRYHLTYLVGWTQKELQNFYYAVLESVGDSCPSTTAIFDPWKPPPEQVGTKKTVDQFPVGDLFNRQLYNFYLDTPLIGSATILGHAVCTD